MITLYNEKDQKVKLISTFEFTESDMGESSISTTVLFDKEQDFHPDWYVMYNGEKFRLGVRKPTGKKDASSLSTSYTLVFKSEREDLKRYTFMDFIELGTGNPQPNSYNVPLYATLSEFVDRFNVNLKYYMGSRWLMILPDDYVESNNAISMSFDNITLWDVLLQVYELFGVRWAIREIDGVMQIQVGFLSDEVEHIFEYGKNNGLVSIERNNSLERIVTRLRGRGSDRNLPPDYFHVGDDDTTPELQSMYFKNLMPKAFRDYIRGYKKGEGQGTWAYNQGVSDKVAGKPLNPVDYVVSDKEDLWGISYGAIDANEEIFPTLQGITRDGVRLDEVLFAEQVLQDKVSEPTEAESIVIGTGGEASSVGYCGDEGSYGYNCTEGISFTLLTDEFVVEPAINTVAISIGTDASFINADGILEPIGFGKDTTVLADITLELLDTNIAPGNVIATHSLSNDNLYTWRLNDVAPGKYRFRANVSWSANLKYESSIKNVKVTIKSRLFEGQIFGYNSEGDRHEFKETFDIEIRDVWGIAREDNESDEDYTYRVWGPLAVSEEMTVMFSDGSLAGEDYEFRVVGFTSESDNLKLVITNAIKPIKEGWRLTLQKSDAEVEASGMYLPNTMQNAKEGDHFFFVNIAMPYDPYVYEAEARVDAWLDGQLSSLDEEFPSFTVSPSKIFCSNFKEVNKLQAGSKIRIRNTALIGESYTSLYIQSLTKRYSDSSLNPDWSLVVSDQIIATGNPVSTLEGSVKLLSQQVYSNRQAVKEAIKALSDTFLRKDGIRDVSYSPTEFTERVELRDGVADKDFNRGDISGKGFGVYTDGNGNRVVEADILVGRIGARFNEVVINQTSYSGGKQVFSAAGMTVSRVEVLEDVYRCYFDTKNGTIDNLFAVNDGAYSQRFAGAGIRTYWNRVVAVGPDYIDLSKTDCLDSNINPLVGDNIVQLGNSVNKSRQAALIIDMMRDGGGLVTWYDDITGYTLNKKDSVNIGRVEGKTWLQVFGSGYIGARDESQYMKYENGKLSIKGRLEVGTTLADGTDLTEAIANAGGVDYLKRALKESTIIEGGLVQTSALVLGYTDDYGTFHVMSGTNGIYDADSTGGGIAAWYGGNMVDAEDGTGAQSLFRFDGSGYLAGGNVRWDKFGAGAVAGGDISWDKDGNITLGYGIKISADGDETLGTILAAVNKIFDLFTEQVDSEGNTTAIIANYNLYSRGGLTARYNGGESGGSGGGASNLWELNDVTITSPTNGQVLTYRDGVWVNEAVQGGGSSDWSAITDKPTTLSGYGITDALSTSGGTISGGYSPLTINRNDGITSYITFSNYSKVLGYLGFEEDGPAYTTTNWEIHRLLHSGNIGGYAPIYNANGNILIGTATDNGVDKLQVNGTISLTPVNNGEAQLSLEMKGTYTQVQTLYKNVSFTCPLALNPLGGNVLIGNTSDNGAKLQVTSTDSGMREIVILDGSGTGWGYNYTNIEFRHQGARKAQIGWNSVDKGAGIENNGGAFIGNLVTGEHLSLHNEGGMMAYTSMLQVSGNVLIGTTTDSGDKLQVAEIIRIKSNSNGYSGTHFDLNTSSSESWHLSARGGESGKPFRFYYYDGNTFNPRVDITSSGNVLIGTTTDNGGKLQVIGDVAANSFSSNPNDYHVANGKNIPWYGLSVNDGYTKGVWLSGYTFVQIQTANSYFKVSQGSVDTNAPVNVYGNISVSGQSDVAIYTSSTPSTASANNTGLFRWGVFDEKTGGFKSQFGGDDCQWQIIDRQWSKALFSFSSSGNFSAYGGITARYASDKRLKEDIQTISTEVALATIMALNPITFRWNAKATELCSWLNGESQGFIAQDYEQIIPNSGSEMWGEYRGIDYNRAIPYIVAVEQNHEQRIKQLEEELQTLKREYYGNR